MLKLGAPSTALGRNAAIVLAFGFLTALVATWLGGFSRIGTISILVGIVMSLVAVRQGGRSVLGTDALVAVIAVGFLVAQATE